MHPSIVHERPKKIILLGNEGVGKTSLAARWLQGYYNPDIVPTVGASNSLQEIAIGNRIVRISLWDTAGQEKFRSITPLYIRGARVAIIVASANCLESFHAVVEWLDLLVSTQPRPIPAIFAVNKSDLVDPWADESCSALIELYRSSFVTVFAVSALSGDQVTELFTEAARIAEFTTVALPSTGKGIAAEAKDGQCC
jgi:Ras-related protein Rab-22